MPPRKKYGKAMLLRLSHFELAVIKYMQSRYHAQTTMADVFRSALPVAARVDPRFDADDFRAFVEDRVAAKVESDKDRKRLMADVESFLSTFADVKAVIPVEGHTELDQLRPRFSSSAEDFETNIETRRFTAAIDDFDV